MQRSGHQTGFMRLRVSASSLFAVISANTLFSSSCSAVILLAAIVSPVFFQTKNLFNILRQASALGHPRRRPDRRGDHGGIDLSVAAVMQLAGVTVAEMTKGSDARVWLALPAVLAAGSLIGLGNGLLVAKRKVQPFISHPLRRAPRHRAAPPGDPGNTLGHPPGRHPHPGKRIAGSGSERAHHLCRDRPGGERDAEQDDRGPEDLRRRGNPRAAALNGISVDRITILSRMSSAGSWRRCPGVVLVGYLGYADQEIGTGYDLDSIASVAVGGAVLGGGKGRVSGTVAGVLLMAILLNLVLLLKLKVEYQLVLRGLVILGAVAFYSANWTGLKKSLARPPRPRRPKPGERIVWQIPPAPREEWSALQAWKSSYEKESRP